MTSSQCDAMKVSSSLNYEARIERLGVLSSRPSRPQRRHELGKVISSAIMMRATAAPDGCSCSGCSARRAAVP